MNFEYYKLKNRIVMGAMTRCRADPETGSPTSLMEKYYFQRAESASIIISEGLFINETASPWAGTPGMYSEAQANEWKPIVQLVKSQSTYFLAQLSHGGRIVHPDLAGGVDPSGPSPIAVNGSTLTPQGMKPYVVPKEMTSSEIDQVVHDYKRSSELVKEAGFDGVEIHCGAGFLLDQFLKSASNHRTDQYGGSVENRARLLLKVLDTILEVFQPNQVCVKLSFVGRSWDSFDDDPIATINYVIPEISKREIFMLDISEAENDGALDSGVLQIPNVAQVVRPLWKNLLLINGPKSFDERIRKIEDGEADLAAFATLFIANPDLTDRLYNKWPLAEALTEFYVSGGEQGYTDYPRYSQADI